MTATSQLHGTPMELYALHLKKLSIMIDMWSSWINSVSLNESGIEPALDKQIYRTSEIGLSQPNRLLYIHVVVNYVIIIKCQSHNYVILTNQLLFFSIQERYMCKYLDVQKTIHASRRKHPGFGSQFVLFVKGRGCIDKESGVPPPAYNCKHVHMYIVMLTNKVKYADRTSHTHRCASCRLKLYSYVAQFSSEHIHTEAYLN